MEEKIVKGIKKFKIETGVKPTHINVRKEDKEELKKALEITTNTYKTLEIVEDSEIVPWCISLSVGPAKKRTVDYIEMIMM